MSGFRVGDHICGFYFVTNYRRTYLSPNSLESHTIVSPVSFSTQLRQTYKTTEAVPQLRYTFPLYDGVTVSGYTITYADKVLTGIVKQKDDAKKTYQDAVDRGETAGLLESLPAGVFGVTLGNVPAQTELLVDITYCGELKHDAAIDGLRYTLPTSIAPRYGNYPGTVLSSNVTATSMKIIVDIDMGEKSAIRKVQSPGHPISVTMGETSLTNSEGGTKPYSPAQASATLTQESTELGADFILQIVIDDLSRPQAILETHPSIPNQRAIMATMVPKFVLDPSYPEIVFIADQSGSMSGSKNASLVKALKVFLKSLPIGVRFNICAFGNRFQFLWETSQAYNEDNVNRAMDFVTGFGAQYGGTELLEPIKAAFKRRLKDMPFEMLVLTDGQIWGEEQVFEYINQEIESGADARIFTLGIGEDVSHTLVEGLARAGNGFAQFVTQNEDTDQKVMRMLKGALYAHTKDYKLEVNYEQEDDDDFEIIEKVQDCLKITVTEPKATEPPKAKSFFDTSVDVDEDPAPKGRYAHLPSVDTPKLLQTPSKIPPLFLFNRSTAYILLDDKSAHKDVKSVTLRATSPSGPLELEIPISGKTQGVSIHQMAARKAIQELEEGRGWLHAAKLKDVERSLVKEQYASRFDEIVEREAVRLGETFQVASNWTSFVAVQTDTSEEQNNDGPERHPPSLKPMRKQLASMTARRSAPSPAPSGSWGGGSALLQQQGMQMQMSQQQSAPATRSRTQASTGGFFASAFGGGGGSSRGGLFGNARASQAPRGGLFGSTSASRASSGGPFGTNASQAPSGGLFGRSASQAPPGGLFGNAPLPPPPPMAPAPAYTASGSSAPAAAFSADAGGDEEEAEESEGDMGFALMDEDDKVQAYKSVPPASDESVTTSKKKKYSLKPRERKSVLGNIADKVLKRDQKRAKTSGSGSVLHDLIDEQTFSGSWKNSDELLDLIGIENGDKALQAFGTVDRDVAMTALVVAYFETVLKDKKDVWEMIVQKARAWLAGSLAGKESADELVEKAKAYLPTQ
ncbi:hypothetical protein CKM354_000613300 [Cercospora kikuchii]|uniref:Uncharacterized protein n=1 Tax=Cercospora kikuchii TaxID=84275 RepID=A0A9P3FHX4_9PEZI|nr:uncharacterized protein CKM354_000613300 [Cercospora kikuchii]GIZ42885.1 hypothetical protein CKM354_000613300 [Cercospora kikuchii]